MKTTMEFQLPEEREDFETHLRAWEYKLAYEDIWQRIFRPRHKHGYESERITKLANSKHGSELMDYLEEIYRNIRDERLDNQ